LTDERRSRTINTRFRALAFSVMRMTTRQVELRLSSIERELRLLKSQVKSGASRGKRWWIDDAGRFANDPVFDEIVALGSAYRRSLRPAPRKRRG